MASINSYGGLEHRGDGSRWTQPAPKPGSGGVGGRPLSQLGGVALSSYKAGEGVNVDRPAEDDSDSSDRGENGFAAASQQKSAVQRAKDKAQQQQQQQTSASVKGAAKVVAARGKQRKLREKRRGTGVVHLSVSDQSTGDSLDDDDDDANGDGTKHNTNSNEGSGEAVLAQSSARASSDVTTAAASSTSTEQPSKFGPRAVTSNSYSRSWQPEPSANATGVEASGAPVSARLYSESPGREESPTAPALRSCLKTANNASAKDASNRRPVTSLVNRFEQSRPQAFPNGSGSGGVNTAPLQPSSAYAPARGSREDGGSAYASQFRGLKEEDAGRGSGSSASYPAGASSVVPRYAGDVSGYANSSWTGPTPSQGMGLAARSSVSAAAPPMPQPARAPVLPPWKQPVQDSTPATAVSSGSSPMSSSATVATQHGSPSALSFGRTSMPNTDDGSKSSATVAPANRQMNEQNRRADPAGTGSAVVDDLQRKIADLQKSVEKLQATNSQYQRTLAERERELEKLENDLQVKNARIAELERDLDELDHDNISLAEENDALRNAVATLSKQ